MSCAVTHNTRLNGVEIRFAGRPDDAVLEQVKAKGFRWSRTNQNWYKGYSESLMQWAIDFCGNPANEAEVVMPRGRVRLITNATLTSGGKVPINMLKSEIEAGKLEYARSERSRMDDSYETIPVAERTYKKADLNSDDYLMKDLRNNPKSFNEHWTNSIRLDDNGTISVRGYEFRYLPDVEGAEYNAREAREAVTQKAAAAGSVAFEYLAGNLFVPINRKPQDGPFTIPADQVFDKETEAVGEYPGMGSYHGYPVAGIIRVKEQTSTITSWTFGSQTRETKLEVYRNVDFFVGSTASYSNRLWVQTMRQAQPGDAEIPFVGKMIEDDQPYEFWDELLKDVSIYQGTLAAADRAKKVENKNSLKRNAANAASAIERKKGKWLAFEEASQENKDLCRAITGETIGEQNYRMMLWPPQKSYLQETMLKVLEREVRAASRTRQPEPIATWEAWERGEKMVESKPVAKAEQPQYGLVPFEALKVGDVIVSKDGYNTKTYFMFTAPANGAILGNLFEGVMIWNYGWDGTPKKKGRMKVLTQFAENRNAANEKALRKEFANDSKLPDSKQLFEKVPVSELAGFVQTLTFDPQYDIFQDSKNADQLREQFKDNSAVAAVLERIENQGPIRKSNPPLFNITLYQDKIREIKQAARSKDLTQADVQAFLDELYAVEGSEDSDTAADMRKELLRYLNELKSDRVEALRKQIPVEEDSSYRYADGDEERYFKIVDDIRTGKIPSRLQALANEQAAKTAAREKQYEMGYNRDAYGLPQEGKKYYYVSAKDGAKTSLVLGPFSTHLAALQMIDAAEIQARKSKDYSPAISWGTAGTDVYQGQGILNPQFPNADFVAAPTPDSPLQTPDPTPAPTAAQLQAQLRLTGTALKYESDPTKVAALQAQERLLKTAIKFS